MRSFDRRLSILILSLVGITGVGTYILDHYFKVETVFGLRQSPWLEYFEDFHILLAPLTVFFIGYIWKDHIRVRYKRSRGPKKQSGILLISLLIFSTVTGFLLFVVENPLLDLEALHFWSGVVILLAYSAHHMIKK